MGIYDRPYYRDSGLPALAPWDQRSMVSNIIIANVALFVVNMLFTNRSGAFTSFLMVNPELMAAPWEWYRVLTYGFVHSPSDPMHIIINMLSLYFLGRSVEDRYGRWEFLRYYLVAIVLGGLYWVIRTWGGAGNPMLGASGGVTAVSMLFVFCFPKAQLLLFGVIPMPAWLLGVMIVVGNMLGGRGGVAYDVHLVGAAFAAVYFYGNLNFAFVGEWFSGLQLAFKQKQRGFKVHRPDEPVALPPREEAEADRILAKIHESGQDSLTAAERKFMEAYSRRVREKRSKSD